MLLLATSESSTIQGQTSHGELLAGALAPPMAPTFPAMTRLALRKHQSGTFLFVTIPTQACRP